MKNLRTVFRFFGLLDIIIIIRFANLIIPLFISGIRTAVPWAFLNSVEAILLGTIAFSAIGFLRNDKWVYLLYYIQFPFRLFFLIFSFGFIAYFNQLFQNQYFYTILLCIAVAGEFFRLIVVIKMHRTKQNLV